MARTKNLSAYPEAYARVIEEGVLGYREIPMPSSEDANRLRGKLYAYFGALYKAAEEFDCPEEIKNLAMQAKRVQLRVQGAVIIIRPQDQDPDALHILATLGDGSTLPSGRPTPQQALTRTMDSLHHTSGYPAGGIPVPSSDFLNALAKGRK